MDTAKAANLFTVYKDADLFDFINAPVGKGLPITEALRPLIAGSCSPTAMRVYILSRYLQYRQLLGLAQRRQEPPFWTSLRCHSKLVSQIER